METKGKRKEASWIVQTLFAFGLTAVGGLSVYVYGSIKEDKAAKVKSAIDSISLYLDIKCLKESDSIQCKEISHIKHAIMKDSLKQATVDNRQDNAISIIKEGFEQVAKKQDLDIIIRMLKDISMEQSINSNTK